MTDDDTRSFDDVQAEVTGDDHGEAHRHSENVENDTDETDVLLTPHDMDHLIAGQPVYKGVNGYLVNLYMTGWDDESAPKHTTGTIDGHSFTLTVDGDAPEALVARIESALADLKAGIDTTPNDELRALVTEIREKAENKYDVGGLLAADELEALLDDTQDNE